MTIAVVMGVSGSGKTTIGRAVAEAIGAAFLEGDEFHPAANIAKMSRGEPLDDADRAPWLDRMADELARAESAGRSVVLAASVLKRAYRDRLRRAAPDLRLIYLKGGEGLIHERMIARKTHFMPAGLLDSQFSALEEPGPDESPIVIDVTPPMATVVGQLRRLLR